MARDKNKNTYAKGTLDELINRIAKHYKDDPKYLSAIIKIAYPQFSDHTRCPNCRASMAIYWYYVDYHIAMLLLQMGNVVKGKVKKGMTFKEANRVHVQTDIAGNYATKSRTTWASKLGLITKVLVDGKHDVKAGWLITKRGYQFLRNEPVPQRVSVFRNEIKDHSDEMITFIEAMSKVHTLQKGEYNQSDWVDIENYAQGAMF